VSRPVQVLALVSAAALAVFASRIAEPYNGVVQRIAVTLPLTAEILIAGRMPILPITGFRCRARRHTRPGSAGQPGRLSLNPPRKFGVPFLRVRTRRS
jgi:hypothetical protein